MYGYLKPQISKVEFSVHKYYREQYCSLCHALWNYYGFLPRFLLSYDITFAAVIIDAECQVDFNRNKNLCYKRTPIKSDYEKWKGLAALTILLAAGKFRDDVDDDNSIIAKAFLLLYSHHIKKAKNDYPILSNLLVERLRELKELEAKNASLEQMSDSFAKMMCDAYKTISDTTEHTLAIVHHITKWVYFIDAVDDLDKDIRKGRYNPLIQIAKSHEDLISNHLEYILAFIKQQQNNITPFRARLHTKSLQNALILDILNDTIPNTTKEILLKAKKDTRSRHLRFIQSKEGIVFE